MSGTPNKLKYGNNLHHWTFFGLGRWLLLFLFFSPKPNSSPTHLPKHESLRSNNKFCQRIWYVECYSVHACMKWSQKFRLTLVLNCRIRLDCDRETGSCLTLANMSMHGCKIGRFATNFQKFGRISGWLAVRFLSWSLAFLPVFTIVWPNFFLLAVFKNMSVF